MKSLLRTTTIKLELSPDCRTLKQGSCTGEIDCNGGMDSDQSGPAAQLIWASFVKLHDTFEVYDDALGKAVQQITLSLGRFGNKFAPIPEEEDNTYLFALIDPLIWGAATAAGPFFNSAIRKLPYFRRNPNTHDNAKDTTMTFIGQSTTLAKDLMGSKEGSWKPEDMNSFAAYMGSVIKGWQRVNTDMLFWLFDGTDDAIDTLWALISGAKLLCSSGSTGGESTVEQDKELATTIEKTLYGYTIPMLWNVSSAHAFVLDSGANCLESYPADKYLTKPTADATSVCHNGRRYYLVYPEGESEKCECPLDRPCKCENKFFSVPPGVEALDGSSFGGITVKDLVAGAVNTYKHNGKKNILRDYDLTSNKATLAALPDVDVTIAGIVRLPVCRPARAWQSWDTTKKGSTDFYPCDIPDGPVRCEESTYENETSDTSPWIKDCEDIIKNTEEDGSTGWTVVVSGMRQRKIAASGTCAFGVEATKVDGNIEVYFGGQDVKNIINASIKKYGKNGKIGAVGDLHCKGNIKQQPVHWAIYHT